jgi:hypothetical protein
MSQQQIDYFHRISWDRASTIFKDSLTLFKNGELKMENLKTGRLANCYLWSAVQILAERDPALVKGLFKTTEINQAGVYAFNFYVNGVP